MVAIESPAENRGWRHFLATSSSQVEIFSWGSAPSEMQTLRKFRPAVFFLIRKISGDLS